AARNSVSILPAQEPGNGLYTTLRALRRSGQHSDLLQHDHADRTCRMASHSRWMQGDHPPTPGPNTDPDDRRTSRRTLQRGRKAVDAADQKTNQGRGKDVGRKSQKADFPTPLANP